MNPEKQIVESWLNKHGFFTIVDVNAGSRVIDFIAIRQNVSPAIWHVEVSCSVSASNAMQRGKTDLDNKFSDKSVVATVKKTIKTFTGKDVNYEKVLIATQRISLPDITVIPFNNVLIETVSSLDRQHYSNPVVRTLQIIKYIFLSNPKGAAYLVSSGGEHRSSTRVDRETFATTLMNQFDVRRIFRKKEHEDTLINLLKESTLKQPERLADALDKVLTKKSATKFFNVLLKRQNMKSALLAEVSNDHKLHKFFK